jgi:L-iditol 2-dehydrogenase
MKVARYYSPEDIRIEEVPIPEVGDREALVKIVACGLCTGEAMSWYMQRKAPIVFGHEPAGYIYKIGGKVKDFKEGERVFVHHHVPCMTCYFCRRGLYSQCKFWRESHIYPGGLAEYVLVDEEHLKVDTLKLPESITYEDATLIEPTACVVKSLRNAGIRRGDTLLIIGLGVMGQLHILLAPFYGAGKIIAADRVPYRIEKAKEFGAQIVINVDMQDIEKVVKEATDGRGVDVVIVGPGTREAIETALNVVGPGGTVLLFTPTPPSERIEISPNILYFKEIKLIPSYSAGPYDTREALLWIERGTVRAERLVTHRFPLERIKEAYKLMVEAKNSLKILIKMEDME